MWSETVGAVAASNPNNILQAFDGDDLTDGRRAYQDFIKLLDDLNPATNNAFHAAKMDATHYTSLRALAIKYYEIQGRRNKENNTDEGDAIVMQCFLDYLKNLQALIIASISQQGAGGHNEEAQKTLYNRQPGLLQNCLKNIETQLLAGSENTKLTQKTIHPALAAIIGGIVGAVIGGVVFGALGLLMSLPIGGVGVFFGAFTGAVKGSTIGATVAITLFSGLAGATMFGGSMRRRRIAKEEALNGASELYQFFKQGSVPSPASST